MNHSDFQIISAKPISSEFLQRGINTFVKACEFIKHLPYGRNANKEDLLSLFAENRGTCSTKHALLKVLADENEFEGLQLQLGLFRMNANNSPAVAVTLAKNGLDYIPEAHNYLRFKGEIIDCTKSTPFDGFEKEIMDEITIRPDQITGFKVHWHKKMLLEWLLDNKGISFNLHEIWNIREQCIKDLQD